MNRREGDAVGEKVGRWLLQTPLNAPARKRRLAKFFSWTAGSQRSTFDSSPSVQLDQAVRYWGLLKAPFDCSATSPAGIISAADWSTFYHAGPTRQQATAWLQHQLGRSTRSATVLNVTAQPGTGLTAWMRQIVATSGIDRQPVRSVAVDARLCPPDRFLDRYESKLPIDGPVVVFFDRATPMQIARAREATQRSLARPAVPKPQWLVCGTRPGPARADFSMQAPSAEELTRVASAALRQASDGHDRISCEVAVGLADRAANRYDRLAECTHHLLIEGMRLGKRRLTLQDVPECLGGTVSAGSAGWRAAAKAA